MHDQDKLTDEQWRRKLSPERYRVLRKKGTEPAFSGAFYRKDENGTYICAGCGAELFSSETKYDSGSGWPSFWAPLGEAAIDEHEDRSLGMRRTEVTCGRCGGHLGHVFTDGPEPTGMRYCLNSLSLEFSKTAPAEGATVIRCGWEGEDPLSISYHDREWGFPVHDDITHFEFLVLESAQAGLSWMTILRKREGYRKAYDGFDPALVARYDEDKIGELLANPGIVRNRRKIEASINNAWRFLEIQSEFGGFDPYIWGYVEGTPLVGNWSSLDQVPAKTPLSDEISRDLKGRGFAFIGSTIVYAYLQAVGIVNDHLADCFAGKEGA